MPKKKLSLGKLKRLQAALPINTQYGYELIKLKCPTLSKNIISKAFTDSERYKQEVVDAAFEVIAEFNEKIKAQEDLIKSL